MTCVQSCLRQAMGGMTGMDRNRALLGLFSANIPPTSLPLLSLRETHKRISQNRAVRTVAIADPIKKTFIWIGSGQCRAHVLTVPEYFHSSLSCRSFLKLVAPSKTHIWCISKQPMSQKTGRGGFPRRNELVCVAAAKFWKVSCRHGECRTSVTDEKC